MSRAAWVTAKPAEQAMMGALQFNFASPVGMERAVSTAMAYYEQQACSTEGGSPAKSVRLAEIEAQEADVREQYKSGRLPLAVFKTWLAELTQQREALHQPARRKTKSIKRDEFMSAYCKVVAKRLEVFSERRNVAVARESLRELLLDGRVELRSDLKPKRFEGSVTFNADFLQGNHIDIKW